jgi:beta-mannosidase
VPDGAPDGNRRCWGNIVWRFNDPWPIIYSSVVDSFLEPKIAYYFMRRAYDPVLVCFERTPDRIQVWVVNDSLKTAGGTLVVRQLGFDGKVKAQLQKDVSVNSAEAKRCLDLTEWGDISLRSQFLQATFDGREAILLLTAERYLHLPQAQLKVRINGERIEVETDNFARQVTLEFDGISGAVFEDNFFDMGPGRKRQIRIIHAAGGKQMTVRALNAEPAVLRLQAK